jgi:hypothetical protein
MKKFSLAFLPVLVFVYCNSPKKTTEEKREVVMEEWQQLFDGKSFSGWHKYGGGPVGSAWKVADGTFYLDTSLNDHTDQEFENFDLKLEWKISKGGNSGIMFYVHEDKAYHWPWETGPEMQILDNVDAGDNKIESHLAGNLYDLIGTAGKSKPKAVGDWNEVEIKCLNGKLDLFLNGANVVSTTLWTDNWKNLVAGSKFKSMPGFGTYKKGRIALQDHGNMVWFRNIMIKRL